VATIDSSRDATAAELIARIGRVFAHYQQEGDPADVLDEELLGAAGRLVVSSTVDAGGTVPIDVAFAVALLRSCRYHAGDLEEDRVVATAVVADLAAAGHSDLVEPLTALLDSDPSTAVAVEAARLLGEAQVGGDVEAAVTVAALAVDETPADHPDRAGRLSNHGLALRLRFDRVGVLADLDAAIEAGTRAVDVAAADDPDLVGYLANLADSYQTRHEITGHDEDLHAALDGYRAAVAAAAHHPAAARIWSDLASALVAAAPGGGPEILDEAVRVGEHAVLLAADTEYAPGCWSVLAVAKASRATATGSASDLDEAIALARAAVTGVGEGHPAFPGRQSNLGAILHLRYLRHDAAADLNDAIVAAAAAVRGMERDVAHGGKYLTNLAYLLRVRAEREEDRAHADAAVEVAATALASTAPGHPARPTRSAMLAMALLTRYELEPDAADLTGALTTLEAVLPDLNDGHPDRALVLTNLCALLHQRFDLAESLDDLRAAIAAGSGAVAVLDPSHPDVAGAQLNLGTALAARYRATGQAEDLRAALRAWQTAAASGTGPVDVRLAACRRWAAEATDAGLLTSSGEAGTAALALLPLLAWRGASRQDQERRIARTAGAGRDAAASWVAAHAPDRATAALEMGRAVLWTQLLDARNDLAALDERAPMLARAVRRTRAALDAPTGPLAKQVR